MKSNYLINIILKNSIKISDWTSIGLHVCIVKPLLWSLLQSGQRSSSLFQDKSEDFPGVTPQLLHLIHSIQICKETKQTSLMALSLYE